jgi:hypothetical protein
MHGHGNARAEVEDEDVEERECWSQMAHAAVERLQEMELIVMADWLHLSGPLICRRLGVCDAEMLAETQHAARTQDPACCGARASLPLTSQAAEFTFEHVCGRLPRSPCSLLTCQF